MSQKLFIGNLSYQVTSDQLRDLFATVGSVSSAEVIIDRQTNRSKGFGFVEMSNEAETQVAIDKLNESELDGRNIIVNVARPREERAPRQGGGGGYGAGPNRSQNRPSGQSSGRGSGGRRY
ncbi:MAG: RNA-binding protein [Candidatus Saccharimonadales bacterium]